MSNRAVIFDVTPESVKKVAANIKGRNEDSLLVLAPISGNISVHAPAKTGKSKGYHRFKFEVWVPEDAIKGEAALTDFGATVLMRLPINRVESHLIREQEEE